MAGVLTLTQPSSVFIGTRFGSQSYFLYKVCENKLYITSIKIHPVHGPPEANPHVDHNESMDSRLRPHIGSGT